MSTAPLPMPHILGVWDESSEPLCAWLSSFAHDPRHSYPLPVELQYGRWMAIDHALIEIAEVTAIRWQHIEQACPGRGAEIAATLRAAGYHAIAFMQPHALVPRAMVQLLGGDCVADLAASLDGHIYLVPHEAWTCEAAAAIEADAHRELLASAKSDAMEWDMSPLRLAFFDARQPSEHVSAKVAEAMITRSLP